MAARLPAQNDADHDAEPDWDVLHHRRQLRLRGRPRAPGGGPGRARRRGGAANRPAGGAGRGAGTRKVLPRRPGRARSRGGRGRGRRTAAGFDVIDTLVNNAGLALGLQKAPQADLDDWDRWSTPTARGWSTSRAPCCRGMVERGRGHVINLGSVAGTYPYPGGNVYGATKAFVHQFSLNLRSELHGTGAARHVHRAGHVRRNRVLARCASGATARRPRGSTPACSRCRLTTWRGPSSGPRRSPRT